ncbi:malonic semialdehyde reductase [Streptomyces sp. B21-083]|uniref:malonic semialdehyde reductase n=1 Tax=Streptomyces sp. B21-083 TaxID=3039410 RepID=UPI002FEFB585
MTTSLTAEGFPTHLAPIDEAAQAALFTQARTVNSFTDTPVSEEELSAIWELAKWAPTAANTQPMRVLFVRTPEGKERLVKHMAEGNAAKTASAPATAVLAVDTRFHEHIPHLLPFRPEMKDALEANEEMRTGLGTYNAALQAGYFILAVRAHGLAAGPMAGFDKDGIDQEFFPDGRWRSTLVVNIGHPGERPWFARLPRLEADSVVSWA